MRGGRRSGFPEGEDARHGVGPQTHRQSKGAQREQRDGEHEGRPGRLSAQRPPQHPADHDGQDRHRHQPEQIGQTEPARGHLRRHQWRRQAHHGDPGQHHEHQHLAGVKRPALQRAFGLQGQPARTQQGVATDQRKAGHQAEGREPIHHVAGELPVRHLESLDEGAQHCPLEECRHHRAQIEGHVPHAPAALRLETELKGHAAEHQGKQHEQNGDIECRHEQPIGLGEGGEQAAAGKHQPGFVAVPVGRDAVHHQVAFLVGATPGKQDADPQIEAIKDHIEHQPQAQHPSPDQRNPETRVHRQRLLVTSRRCGWARHGPAAWRQRQDPGE